MMMVLVCEMCGGEAVRREYDHELICTGCEACVDFCICEEDEDDDQD